MGLAEIFLGAQNPFTKFVSANQGRIRGAGMGLAQGPDFGQGLANAAYYANQGATQDDAYAMTLKEQADREAKLQKQIDYLRSTSPQMAELVAAGMDPNAAFGEILRGMRPDGDGTDPTSGMQNYQFLRSLGLDEQTALDRAFSNGGVKVDARNMGSIPPGYRVEYDELGNPVQMVPIAGSPAANDAAAAEEASAANEQRTDLKGTVVVQDIDRALNEITKNPGLTTGIGAQLTQGIGGLPAKNVSELITTVKANAGFNELQAMREASPTGGALGQVTEREIAYLQATIGSLDQAQDAVQLADNLKRVKNAYLDIVHGPGNGPPREPLSFEGAAGGITVSPEVQSLLEKYK